MNPLLFFLLCLTVSSGYAFDCTPTKGDEFCSCKGKGFSIDLRRMMDLPLNNIPDGSSGISDYEYKFSPCQPVACVSGGSSNGVVCQNSVTKPDAWYLARTTVTPEWVVQTMKPSLIFSVTYYGGDKTQGGSTERERIASLTFQFSSQNELEIAMFGETQPNNFQRYNFIGSGTSIALQKRSTGVEVGVVGIILMVLFIVALVVYFIIGATVNYIYRGARGVEVIPNYQLWKGLPFLIKDGFLFTISPCYKTEKYQKF